MSANMSPNSDKCVITEGNMWEVVSYHVNIAEEVHKALKQEWDGIHKHMSWTLLILSVLHWSNLDIPV